LDISFVSISRDKRGSVQQPLLGLMVDLGERIIAESLTDRADGNSSSGLLADHGQSEPYRPSSGSKSVEGGANGGIDDIPGTSAAALMSIGDEARLASRLSRDASQSEARSGVATPQIPVPDVPPQHGQRAMP